VLREIKDLELRIGELRQVAAMPEPDLRMALDAALAELDLALGTLQSLAEASATGGPSGEAERRVLRTVFHDAPVALFLVDRNATVRRVNRQAAALVGTSPGYAAGKPFPIFCDLPHRSVLRSQFATVVRTGRRRHLEVRLLGKKSPAEVLVTLARVWIRGEADPLVVVAAVQRRADASAAIEAAPEEPVEDTTLATVVHRMDVLASVTELLLDDPVFNEAVALRRCARLVASELHAWVLIDVAEGDQLRRQVVFGPDIESTGEVTRQVEEAAPVADTLPHRVRASRQGELHAHVEDLGLLGSTADGVLICGLLGAASVISVPIEDREQCLGVLTIAGDGSTGLLDLSDLALVQRIARQLALVTRASRIYGRRSKVADSLQASLLPRTLPSIPGLEVGARYIGATRGVDIGGDFYDIFATNNGWGFVLGDVCGKGEEAAAVTATARNGVRLLALWKEGPAEMLTDVNRVLLAEERFVTAVLAELVAQTGGFGVTLGVAGHPPVIVVRADGTVRTMSGGGVPLGLFEDFEPGVETFDLGPGDTLFLHSDGVLDASDSDRKRFGSERLIEILAMHRGAPLGEMLLSLEQALMDFTDGGLDDDVSVLAVRVQEDTLT
jgi:PAS domain S-box-containing protein